jgi:hypothetical protein
MTGVRGNSDPYFLSYLMSVSSVTAIVTSVAAAAATAIVSSVTTTSGVTVAVVCIAMTPVIVSKQSGVTVLKYVTLAYFHFFDTVVPKRDRDYSRTVAYDSILHSVRFAVTS